MAGPVDDDLREKVRRFMVAAKKEIGTDATFAKALTACGVRANGQPVAGNTVNGWVRGSYMPSAAVLFAAARLSGLSLDEALEQRSSMATRLERVEREVERLSSLLAQMPGEGERP